MREEKPNRMEPPVNLNKARKARSKAAARGQAAANRVAFGRTKADKDAARLAAKRDRATLDGAKREPPES